ncbi:DUF58 domain-containing protein [Natrialbaceae archaeon A-gly3]
MYPTRRSWALAALCVVLAFVAVVLARPLVLAGVVLIGAGLLARSYLFVSDLSRVARTLSVAQAPASTGLTGGESTPVSLVVTLEDPLETAVDVAAGVPTAAVAEGPPSLRLEPGETHAERTFEVSWPVTGRHRFDAATVSVEDGFFTETFTLGDRPTVTVEPRGPRNVHVGEGGERIAGAYGEHVSEGFGSGIQPAELREYVPGDTAERIDWNATARLGSPYVREYETETDRRTLLVVDHRATLATGPPGETKLEYLREVALAVAASAHRLGDPIGLLAVGDEGITRRLEPASTVDRYRTVRRFLLELEATGTRERSDGDGAHRRTTTAVDAERAATAIGGEEDPFSRTLRPFYAEKERYRQRVEDAPLYAGLRRALASPGGRVWTVLFTDDSRADELREAVKLARANGAQVTALLAPSVLYEPGGLGDVERAYHRYREFEDVRRELARIDRVNALEVAPGDRLGAVLADGNVAGGRR